MGVFLGSQYWIFTKKKIGLQETFCAIAAMKKSGCCLAELFVRYCPS